MCLIGVGTCSVLVPAPQVIGSPHFGPIGPVPIALAPANAEYDPHPQYSFAYNVQDAVTGDHKNQQETRDGDVVKGIDCCFTGDILIITWQTT